MHTCVPASHIRHLDTAMCTVISRMFLQYNINVYINNLSVSVSVSVSWKTHKGTEGELKAMAYYACILEKLRICKPLILFQKQNQVIPGSKCQGEVWMNRILEASLNKGFAPRAVPQSRVSEDLYVLHSCTVKSKRKQLLHLPCPSDFEILPSFPALHLF